MLKRSIAVDKQSETFTDFCLVLLFGGWSIERSVGVVRRLVLRYPVDLVHRGSMDWGSVFLGLPEGKCPFKNLYLHRTLRHFFNNIPGSAFCSSTAVDRW